MSLKLKRNLGLPLLLATLAFALILGMGDQRIYAYTVHGSATQVEQTASLGSETAVQIDATAGGIEALH